MLLFIDYEYGSLPEYITQMVTLWVLWIMVECFCMIDSGLVRMTMFSASITFSNTRGGKPCPSIRYLTHGCLVTHVCIRGVGRPLVQLLACHLAFEHQRNFFKIWDQVNETTSIHKSMFPRQMWFKMVLHAFALISKRIQDNDKK